MEAGYALIVSTGGHKVKTNLFGGDVLLSSSFMRVLLRALIHHFSLLYVLV